MSKKNVWRSTIEPALAKGVVQVLEELALPQDGRHLCRGFRALLGVALRVMEAGAAPAYVVSSQLDRVRGRIGIKGTETAPHVPPDTLGFCVLKPGKV